MTGGRCKDIVAKGHTGCVTCSRRQLLLLMMLAWLMLMMVLLMVLLLQLLLLLVKCRMLLLLWLVNDVQIGSLIGQRRGRTYAAVADAAKVRVRVRQLMTGQDGCGSH